MIQVLELSNREFKVTMIKMPKALVKKLVNMQEQMATVIREIETLRKNKMEVLENKHTKMNMKNAFDELIRWLRKELAS